MATFKVGMSLKDAQAMAKELATKLMKLGAKEVEVTGSVIREKPEIGDIDLIVDGEIDKLAEKLDCEVKHTGTERVTLIYKGQQVNLFSGTPENWGAMQMYLAGPKGWVIGMRMRAKRMGFLLNQHGLFDAQGKKVAGAKEHEIFLALGKEWKHPNLRGKR